MKLYSVTEILSKWQDFRNIPDHILGRAALRGTRVHFQCAAYCLNVFSKKCESDLDYLDSFRRWFDKNVERVIFVEKKMIDEILGFHGRPDLVCLLRWNEVAVIDFKTPIVQSSGWKLQLAAYRYLADRELVDSIFEKTQTAFALQLSGSGGIAKAIRYDDWENDFAIFLSALNIHRYFDGEGG